MTQDGCWLPERSHKPFHAGSIPVPASNIKVEKQGGVS